MNNFMSSQRDDDFDKLQYVTADKHPNSEHRI